MYVLLYGIMVFAEYYLIFGEEIEFEIQVICKLFYANRLFNRLNYLII